MHRKLFNAGNTLRHTLRRTPRSNAPADARLMIIYSPRPRLHAPAGIDQQPDPSWTRSPVYIRDYISVSNRRGFTLSAASPLDPQLLTHAAAASGDSIQPSRRRFGHQSTSRKIFRIILQVAPLFQRFCHIWLPSAGSMAPWCDINRLAHDNVM